jgi:CBS-domain-containing membrane protein
MPVINAQRHVVGMVTQSDLVAALFQLMGAASSQPMRQA